MKSSEGMCETFDYALGNAAPCENCCKYMYKYGVKKIKYTDLRKINGELVNVLVELRINRKNSL